MTTEEQNALRTKNYAEAIRYMDNAREVLKKANKEDSYYHDKKYVKMACGTAYSGVWLALDAFLQLKGVKLANKRTRKSIEYYTSHITQMDRKLLADVNLAYEILHLYGYYDGIQDAVVVKRGMDLGHKIIDRIKPL
jgi:hypothetical protein